MLFLDPMSAGHARHGDQAVNTIPIGMIFLADLIWVWAWSLMRGLDASGRRSGLNLPFPGVCLPKKLGNTLCEKKCLRLHPRAYMPVRCERCVHAMIL